MIRKLVAVLVLGTSVLAGCGGGADRPAMVPVSGTVNYNGSPVEGATVTFASETSPRSSTGETDSSGKFRLTTFDTNDGAPAGEYIVTITKFEAEATMDTSAGGSPEKMKEMMDKQRSMMSGAAAVPVPKAKLPTKYADGKTSGEKRKVVAGDANDFNFTLTD